jgi:hypothetical protein
MCGTKISSLPGLREKRVPGPMVVVICSIGFERFVLHMMNNHNKAQEKRPKNVIFVD